MNATSTATDVATTGRTDGPTLVRLPAAAVVSVVALVGVALAGVVAVVGLLWARIRTLLWEGHDVTHGADALNAG